MWNGRLPDEGGFTKMAKTAQDIIRLIQEQDIKMVDFNHDQRHRR